jgi:DNA-binding YbaB/EbfC family protein
MNLQKMMQQAQQMQQKLADMQAKLETEEAEGSSGGGMVKILLNGKHMALKVTIDESMLKPIEKEVLEDLVVAAFNDAKNKIDSKVSDQMGQLTGGMNLPPGFKLPF